MNLQILFFKKGAQNCVFLGKISPNPTFGPLKLLLQMFTQNCITLVYYDSPLQETDCQNMDILLCIFDIKFHGYNEIAFVLLKHVR